MSCSSRRSEAMSLPTWWPVLIPFVLFVLSLIVVRLLVAPRSAKQTERVIRHFAGIGSLALTGGLLFLAYNASDRGVGLVMLVLACAPGYSAYHYLNGGRGVRDDD